MRFLLLSWLALLPALLCSSNNNAPLSTPIKRSLLGECPPCPSCFNCNLGDKCSNFGECNKQIGKCEQCPIGFGTEDCSKPVCGSLTSGDRKIPAPNQGCKCDDGWAGLNCNVCTKDEVCNPLVEAGVNGTCYTGPVVVKRHFKSCTASVPLLEEMFPEKQPAITFGCNIHKQNNNTCSFQFWLDHEENFYCGLQGCARQNGTNANVTYVCDKVHCKCVKGATICSQLIEDVLTQVTGPARFSCSDGQRCHFNEEILDNIIDGGIPLDCLSGECLRPSEVPEYVPPVKEPNITFIVVFMLFVKRQGKMISKSSYKELPEEETRKLLESHIPSKFEFRNIEYSIGEKKILDKIGGIVEPGEVLAIIGPSGSGKTSCLDILAQKRKRGVVSGSIFVNGVKLSGEQLKSVSGFVDQEDTLLGTLTVRETLMYSALLRLPTTMSLEAKKLRVQQTLEELGISHIADRFIGLPGRRGISGGEKRRVSIAQEMVTSPSIIFLDEPTSGLDSYSAFIVVERLKTMARENKRTVIMTIHQPRSNIFSMFDKLLVIAQGKMLFSAGAHDALEHFTKIGYACPPGYNTADFLIDLTMKPEEDSVAATSPMLERNHNEITERTPFLDDRLRNRTNTSVSRLVPAMKAEGSVEEDLANRLLFFASSFLTSPLSAYLKEETVMTNIAISIDTVANAGDKSQGRQKPDFMGQLSILSGRTLLNLYRNPLLLFAHYALSILLAILCGGLYWQVSDDLGGVQNRLGCLFFICAFFGFGSMTSLEFFQSERVLFTRERANGFYQTSVYYLSKILFDLIPLRVIPPLLFGSIVYYLVGFYSDSMTFLRFILSLVLFNLSCSSICLVIAILIENHGVANLVASLTILFSMLFGGFLLNKDSIPAVLSWLKYLSTFYYAYEALIVNELINVKLRDQTIIDVVIAGRLILKQFGFDEDGYVRNVISLAVMFTVSLIVAFLFLKFLVKEKR